MTDYSTIGMNNAVLRIRIQVPSNPKTDPDPGHEHLCKVYQFLDSEIL